jgi:hypothetical protein
MRIKHKYLRNRHFKTKSKNRAKSILGEFSYKAYFPYWIYGQLYDSPEKQLLHHQKEIEDLSNTFIRGDKSGRHHAPRSHKCLLEQRRRASNHLSLKKIMNGYEDVEFETFKQDADWDWF